MSQRRHASLTVALLALSSALFAEPARERTFSVESRGWVRVPLAEEVLRDGPASGLQVIGPDGEAMPLRIVSDEEGRTFAVSVIAVQRADDGWIVELDAGQRAPRHDRLHFDFEQRAALSGVRLSSSADRRRFRPLASGDLFRLGESGGLAQVDLAYPPTADRYLRLLWPLAGDLPELQRVAVDEVGSGRRRVTAELRCTSDDLLTVCDLPLPEEAVVPRALEIDLETEAAAGVRLLQPDDGRWELVRQTVFEAGSRSRHVLPVPTLVAGTSSLRLELSGVNSPPALGEASWQLPNLAIEIFARQTGSHRLRSGASVGPGRILHPPPAGAAIRRSELSAAITVERSGPSLATLARGGELPAATTRARCPVQAETGPLSWVRLELPREVLEAAEGQIAGLRLSDGAAQVPYLVWSPPEPALETALTDVSFSRPAAAAGSRAGLAVVPGDYPWRRQLVLYAPARPIERAVRLLGTIPSPRPGVPGSEHWIGGEQWSCSPHAALPCRLPLNLSGWTSGELSIEVDDGDNPALTGVRAELWHDRQELIFLWPESGSVELLVYSDLRAPRYDLAAYRESLLRYPTVPATAGALERDPEAIHWPSWVLPAVVALAAMLLLGLLLKLLRGEGEPRPER